MFLFSNRISPYLCESVWVTSVNSNHKRIQVEMDTTIVKISPHYTKQAQIIQAHKSWSMLIKGLEIF